jgi:hypothetical protein
MARKKMQPAEVVLNFSLAAGTASDLKYIDLAQCESFVNRRLYPQGHNYYISRVTFINATGGSCSIATLPDTWVTANAWVKAKALWNTMNKGVLADNPSIKGKWADFKVFFDKVHYDGGYTSAGPTLNILPIDMANAEIEPGEWYMSTYVSPQHDVNAGTGVELPADEYKAHMLGPDSGAAGSRGSAGIIAGYEATRARVQIAPDVPADMQTNWMTELSDLGGQDPELANVLEDANDNPPYDLDEYPGGATNFIGGVPQTALVTSTSLVVEKDIGFKVPLGLLKVMHVSQGTGNLIIHLTPGHHKGVMCTEVKQ